MKRLFHKISFCYRITADFSSFLKLIWNSKKLSWSKAGIVKPSAPGIVSCITLRLNGEKRKVYLRTYAGDIDIFYEIFYKEIYDLPPHVFKCVKVIIDVGSNIGLSVLYFLAKVPSATIIAVEPDPGNFEMLSSNLAPEIKAGKVRLFKAAVMHKAGEVPFVEAKYKFNNRVSEDEAGFKIPATSMQILFDRFGINNVDLVKMDIEGSEKYIFSGDISWMNHISNIIIELHSEEDRRIVMDAFTKYRFITDPLKNSSDNMLYWAKRIEVDNTEFTS